MSKTKIAEKDDILEDDIFSDILTIGYFYHGIKFILEIGKSFVGFQPNKTLNIVGYENKLNEFSEHKKIIYQIYNNFFFDTIQFKDVLFDNFDLSGLKNLKWIYFINSIIEGEIKTNKEIKYVRFENNKLKKLPDKISFANFVKNYNDILKFNLSNCSISGFNLDYEKIDFLCKMKADKLLFINDSNICLSEAKFDELKNGKGIVFFSTNKMTFVEDLEVSDDLELF